VSRHAAKFGSGSSVLCTRSRIASWTSVLLCFRPTIVPQRPSALGVAHRPEQLAQLLGGRQVALALDVQRLADGEQVAHERLIEIRHIESG
jgi:hypothetical protein